MADSESGNVNSALCQRALRQASRSFSSGIPRLRQGASPASFDAPSGERRAASLAEQPFDLDEDVSTQLQKIDKSRTVFYLAYGSNLSAETFLGRRGIKPLAAVNVVVPSLRLTFDLPGVPYTEPCFANSGIRDPNHPQLTFPAGTSEKTALLSEPQKKPSYHKDRWHKGMVGVAYELTLADFAHVIATEGGGSSYQDILVDCFPLESGSSTVPEKPSSKSFKTHTLFAPSVSPPGVGDGDRDPSKGRSHRPDPSYAQPSARYMKLLTDGAEEHHLPGEYRDFLAQIRPYTITTKKQRMGQVLFMAIWGPILTIIFMLGPMFADRDGKSPEWLRKLVAGFFTAMWISYDRLFKKLFGDGERTIGQGGKPADPEDEQDLWTRRCKMTQMERGTYNRCAQ